MKVHMLGALVAAALLGTSSGAQARWHLFGDDGWFHHRHHMSIDDQYNTADQMDPNTAPNPGQRPLTSAEQLQQAQTAAADPRVQQLASKLFCYCGCDKADGHQNLLDCYKTGHVPVCKTCQGEFIRASQMNAQGSSLAEIQDSIDQEFSRVYPPGPQSETLKRYLAGKEHPEM